MAKLTTGQALLQILKNRKFSDVEISQLSGIHRVTINKIKHGTYSGRNSIVKLEQIVTKLTDISNSEINLIKSAIYHNDIPDTQIRNNIHNKDNIIKTDKLLDLPDLPELVIVTNQRVTLKNVGSIAMKWKQTYDICTVCKNRLGDYSSVYFSNTFAICCNACLTRYSMYTSPIPTN